MRFYLLHKPSNIQIQFERLRENPYLGYGFFDERFGREYKYYARDIIFSKDFELECVEDAYTIEELKQIDNALHMDYSNSNHDLMQKVRNNYIELIKQNR